MLDLNLVLNFLPITIIGDSFKSYVNKYESKEHLEKLRYAFPNCIFHRMGEEVHCIPVSEGKTIGEERLLKVNESAGIIRRLISEKISGFVWSELGSKDVRDVIKMASLVKDESDLDWIKAISAKIFL